MRQANIRGIYRRKGQLHVTPHPNAKSQTGPPQGK
jgi:hypothetical protein